MFSVTSLFSFLSVNSVFSVLSVNSMMSLGCVNEEFTNCYSEQYKNQQKLLDELKKFGIIKRNQLPPTTPDGQLIPSTDDGKLEDEAAPLEFPAVKSRKFKAQAHMSPGEMSYEHVI